ncbi:Crp/Fnr family transcriptional regulator [Marivirga salinae]|uniref:Crp/Fnr family transcriptional regulator n=1 Tax=Marivirga salinarum TaxID=3059078 RepID=A0AA51NB30_9BACT|nr:Crp/Fnr family transcriptional regulator [Marivirga sp. BDSF4-3]WMN12082.1 Crp/Fnr family transcriptional regulator [Marivirga sp. BDSF4-3]
MNIAQYIKKHIDKNFNEGDLPFRTSKKSVTVGHTLCDFGEIENCIYFLIDGIAQVNIMNSKGDVRIIDFFFPENFFCSYTSLIQSTPSDVQIVATTNCELEVVENSELQLAYKNSLLANKLGRYETEKLYLKKVKREKDLLTKTREEIYLELINNKSEIIHQLPIDSIAKYLGIHPESLSRIRKKKTKSN